MLAAMLVGHAAMSWVVELRADYRAAATAMPGIAAGGVASMEARMAMNRVLRSYGLKGFDAKGNAISIHALVSHPPLSLRIALLQQYAQM